MLADGVTLSLPGEDVKTILEQKTIMTRQTQAKLSHSGFVRINPGLRDGPKTATEFR